MRARLIRQEGGFTLSEVLVAMVMMITVMFALYAIFDMSLRVFSFGNDKIEATETTRIGLERMEREIRAAYPLDRTEDPPKLFDTPPGANQITFFLDLNGNHVTAADEQITYDLDGATLERNDQSVVENVSGLNFDYQDRQGNSLNLSTDPLSEVKIVEITLTVEVDEREQTLSTDVSLRNRAE